MEALAEVYPRRGHLATLAAGPGCISARGFAVALASGSALPPDGLPGRGFLLRAELMQGYFAEVSADSRQGWA